MIHRTLTLSEEAISTSDNNDQLVTIATSLTPDGKKYVITMTFSHSHYVSSINNAFTALRNKYITADSWALTVKISNSITVVSMKCLTGKARTCEVAFNGVNFLCLFLGFPKCVKTT